MNIITQDILYKQSVVKYSLKYGVTKATIKFRMHRKTIYRWRERYDGTAVSLKNKSRRPHSHPKQHTAEKIKKIKDYKYKNKDTGLVVLWVKLRKAGYTRSITSLYRAMQRMGIYKKAPSKKKEYEPKPYEKMTHPGERIQIDVKYVPSKNLTKEIREKEGRYYQYTAIDEYTRQRVLWASKKQSTYASTEFLINNISSLTRFSKSKITTKPIEELHKLEIRKETIKIIVSSLRLDNIVSELARTSRTKAEEIIISGRVFVNFENITKDSKMLKQGDVITIRGKGRFEIKQIEGNTKKGRQIVIIEKFA